MDRYIALDADASSCTLGVFPSSAVEALAVSHPGEVR